MACNAAFRITGISQCRLWHLATPALNSCRRRQMQRKHLHRPFITTPHRIILSLKASKLMRLGRACAAVKESPYDPESAARSFVFRSLIFSPSAEATAPTPPPQSLRRFAWDLRRESEGDARQIESPYAFHATAAPSPLIVMPRSMISCHLGSAGGCCRQWT